MSRSLDAHPQPLPALYHVLFEIAAMRQSVSQLSADAASFDADRFLRKLATLELFAMNLLETIETDVGVIAH